MEHQVSGVQAVAAQMATLSAKAAAGANAQRLQIAQGNIDATTSQLKLQETSQRKSIARHLDRHVSSAAASSAYRGASGASVTQGELANTLEASEQVAIVEANTAAQEAAVVAANQVVLEDPILAAIQGGVAGMDMASGVAAALASMTEVNVKKSSVGLDQTGGFGEQIFQNTIKQVAETPGLDLGSLFSFDESGNIVFNFNNLGVTNG